MGSRRLLLLLCTLTGLAAIVFCSENVYAGGCPCEESECCEKDAEARFHVVEVTNFAEPDKYSGPCPVTLTFFGTIMRNGPGDVLYTWIRSDRVQMPVERLAFDERIPTKHVEMTWSIKPVPGEEVWAVLNILSPNPEATGHLGKASPEILCTVGDSDMPDQGIAQRKQQQ